MAFERRSRLRHDWKEGAAYFVTWRLYGSIPVNRIASLWTSGGARFMAGDQLLDACSTGPKWLGQRQIADCVAAILRRGHAEGRFETGACVLMPNHVHLLFRPEASLGGCIARIKGASAREANRILGTSGSPFWAKDYFEHRVRDSTQERIVRYIEKNPVAAGLCTAVEEWPWSSASIIEGLQLRNNIRD